MNYSEVYSIFKGYFGNIVSGKNKITISDNISFQSTHCIGGELKTISKIAPTSVEVTFANGKAYGITGSVSYYDDSHGYGYSGDLCDKDITDMLTRFGFKCNGQLSLF